MIVEDEPAISDVCRRVLEKENFKVDVAANGLIARQMLAEEQYDLLLFDLKTPTMNGKELYQWIKEQHPEIANRVIFTTGDIAGGDTQTFLEQTGRPFLPKPFTPDELKAIILKALE
ncbi:MAG: response regulator [Chloroflexota bacterium]